MKYGVSRKFFQNGDTLLDKPAVPPTTESGIIFENRYKNEERGTQSKMSVKGAGPA